MAGIRSAGQLLIHPLGTIAQINMNGGSNSTLFLSSSAEQINSNFPVLVEWTRVYVAAAVTTLTLDLFGVGDLLEKWTLVADIVNGAGAACDYTLQPNGVTTDQSTAGVNFTGAATANFTATNITFARDVANGTNVMAQTEFWTRIDASGAARPRGFISHDMHRGGAGNADGGIYSAIWDESATTISTIDIVATVASGIGVGSSFALYYHQYL